MCNIFSHLATLLEFTNTGKPPIVCMRCFSLSDVGTPPDIKVLFQCVTAAKNTNVIATVSNRLVQRNSLISRTDKVELIATECFQQSCNCLGYLEQHTKSCKSYLVGKYVNFRLKNDHFYA